MIEKRGSVPKCPAKNKLLPGQELSVVLDICNYKLENIKLWILNILHMHFVILNKREKNGTPERYVASNLAVYLKSPC